MKKLLIACCFCLLPSLSFGGNLLNLGDLEFLNDIGLSQAREVIDTTSKTLGVLGYKQNTGNYDSGWVNHRYGYGKDFHARWKNRQPKTRDVPYIVQDMKAIFGW